MITSLSNFIYAQDNGAYKYTLIRNNPEEPKNLGISVFPFTLDYNDINFNMGFQAQLSYMYKTKASIELNYSLAYVDRMNEDFNKNSEHGYSIDGTSGAKKFEVLSHIFLKKTLKDVFETPHVKFAYSGSTRIDYRVKIPAKRLDLIGLRLGFISGSGYIQNTNGSISFQGYHVNDPSKTLKQFSGSGYSTMMNYKTVVLGLSYTKISDLIINIEGYGEKKLLVETEWYLDLLYAPSITYADMTIPDSYNGSSGSFYDYQRYNVNDNTKKSKIGARLGWKNTPLTKFSAFYYGIELGLLPGPDIGFGNNFNLGAKVGLKFSAKVL